MTNIRKLNNNMEQLDSEDMNDCISLIWNKIKSIFTLKPIPGDAEAAELAC